MDTRQLIKEVTEKQGVSRYRLAKELGVLPSAVYHWESGRKHPNGKHLMELLRRAGRLAAMVTIAAGISAGAAPEVSAAFDTSTHYARNRPLWRRLLDAILSHARLPRTAPTLAI